MADASKRAVFYLVQNASFRVRRDNVDITLSGNSTPTTASWFGTAKQALGMILQAALRGV
jgi:hypothetical protein